MTCKLMKNNLLYVMISRDLIKDLEFLNLVCGQDPTV